MDFGPAGCHGRAVMSRVEMENKHVTGRVLSLLHQVVGMTV